MLIKLKDIQFVRKATYGVPKDQQVKPKEQNKAFGVERTDHKYKNRETNPDGSHKYIYEEAKGKKVPSDKKAQEAMMVARQTMQADKYWKKFEDQFEDADLITLMDIINQKGGMSSGDDFLSELNNMKDYLGARASNYLPREAVMSEYKKLLQLASNQPSQYMSKMEEVASKNEIETQKQTDADMSDLSSSGLNDQTLQELKRDPRKVKGLISKLQKLIGE